MRIIYIYLSVLISLAAVEAREDSQEEICATEKEAPTVKEAVGNALEKTKEAVGEGIQKTKDALVKTKDLTKEAIGNIAEKTLQQVGFSMVEMNEAFECAGPIIDLLEKVSRNPHDPQTLEALKGNRCRGVIKEFAFKCINPKILLAMAVPGVGVAISSVCQTLQRLKERLDEAVKEDVAIYEKKEETPEACPKEHTSEDPGS